MSQKRKSYCRLTLDYIWESFPQTVVISDIVKESGGLIPKNEIAFITSDMLYILRMQSGSLSKMDSVAVVSSGETSRTCWLSAAELDGNEGTDLIISTTFFTSGFSSFMGLYSYDDPGDFYDTRTWSGARFSSIPAVGDLGSGEIIAMSRRVTDSHTQNPVDLLDPSDLSTAESCSTSSALSSNNILCCLMADWGVGSGLDRVISPSENQCFAFVNDGSEDWKEKYDDPSSARPPFPALGDLNGDDNADLLVGTRDGFVYAYDYLGNELQTLGFPYTLPSEVCGGFVIADIDNDEKVEVVFGTMDNYLHVWELGSCDEGYAPWPQVQHDAERTGALE